MEDLRAKFLFCPTPIYFSDFGVFSPCFLRILIPSVLCAYLAIAWAVKTFLTGKFSSSAEDSGYVRLEHEEYAGETEHLLSEDVEETLPGRIARKITEHIPNPKAVLDKSLIDVKVIVHLLIFEIFIVLAAFWFKADEKTPLAHREYPIYAGLWMIAIVPWLLHANMLSRASKSGPITELLQRGGHDSRNIKGFWMLAFALTLVELQHFTVYRKHYLTVGSDSPYAWAAILVASPIIREFGLLPLVANVLFLELGAAKPEHNPAFDIESGIADAAAPIEYEHDVARRQQVLGSHPPAARSPARGDRAVHVAVEEPSPQRSQNGDSLRSEFETILAAARAARQQAAATDKSVPVTRSVESKGPSGPSKAASGAGGVQPAGSSNQTAPSATFSKVEEPKAKSSAPASTDVRLDAPKNSPAKPTPASGSSVPQSSLQKDNSKPADTKLSDDKKSKPADPSPQQIDTPSSAVRKPDSDDVLAAPLLKAKPQEPELKSAVPEVPAPATSAVAGIVADEPASGGPSTLLRHLSTAQSTESLNSTASTNADEDDDESPGAKSTGAGDGAAAKKKKKNKKKKKGKK
ncbi:hypothetical protein HDU88_005931 [Geranomyces variabilis]|nr:hypothetical protein HDU88_005931 [Geranomyces variabilis]